MTAHTPGPWEDRPQHNNTYHQIHSTDGKGGLVAMVYDYCGDEDAANAKLIAAAPELLEACQAAILAIQGMRDKYGTFTSHELDAAKKQAIEAVERAGSKVRDYVVEW